MKLAATVLDAQLGGAPHRTPRYVYHRTRQLLYERSHPQDPWLTPEAIRLLSSMLRPTDRGVEYGSGRSTAWFAARVAELTSVEHDPAWYATVSARLKALGLGNVDYILEPQDQPDELGDTSSYARTAQGFADASVDFVLIDGQYRDHTARLMMPKIKPGGLLIIDNVNWFLPSATLAPASRSLADGPRGPVWRQVAADLADWRRIWTDSGVWNTAIFVRP